MTYLDRLITAFLEGKSAYSASAHTNNGVFFSYDTPIAVYPALGNNAVINIAKYSKTTSKQQNALIKAFEAKGIHVIKCNAPIVNV